MEKSTLRSSSCRTVPLLASPRSADTPDTNLPNFRSKQFHELTSKCRGGRQNPITHDPTSTFVDFSPSFLPRPVIANTILLICPTLAVRQSSSAFRVPVGKLRNRLQYQTDVPQS